jgi:hypothetical protein
MTGASPLPRISPTAVAAFGWYARRLIAKRFSAVRVMADGQPLPSAGPFADPTVPPSFFDGPTILYANHAAWWDPMVLMLVTHAYLRGRRVYAPIDADALQRYPVLARLGLFGVRPDSFAGTRTFLAVGREVLSTPDGVLAITPQGRFADVRERPLSLRGGLAQLMQAVPQARAWPVAIEYPFWNEIRPEILIRFGQQPVVAGEASRESLAERLTERLRSELDRLAEAACSRDPERFRVVLDGASGIGFWQDMPARLRAWARGRRFEAAHSAVRESAQTSNVRGSTRTTNG